ncbi:MAG: hypothetical protein AAE983_07925 [Thermoplasmataceae archaeon]|jgi:hypothetical protein
MTEKPKQLKYVIAGIVAVLIVAGVFYSVYHTSDPSMKLEGTYHLSKDQITVKTFNVTSSGQTFNIKTQGSINATGYFALLVMPSNYTNQFKASLEGNFTISHLQSISTNNSEILGLISVNLGSFLSTVSLVQSKPLSSGEYNVLMINLTGSNNTVSMNTVISY